MTDKYIIMGVDPDGDSFIVRRRHHNDRYFPIDTPIYRSYQLDWHEFQDPVILTYKDAEMVSNSELMMWDNHGLMSCIIMPVEDFEMLRLMII